MYVGDHPINDVDGSRKAGMTSVWFRSVGVWLDGVEPASYSIDTLGEIPNLVDALNNRR